MSFLTPNFTTPLPNYTPTFRHSVYDRIDPRRDLAGSAKGLTVLVTGGGRGVGRSIAITYALAGAKKVIITSRSLNELLEVEKEIKIQTATINSSVEIVVYACSIADEKEVEKLFDIAGNVDILINNAGVLEPWVKVGESKVDQWWSTYEINIKGTYISTREILKRAVFHGRSASNPVTIVNTSSIGSVLSSINASSYSSGKTAINRFSEFLHFESPEARVFCYHPGSVRSKLGMDLPEYIHSSLIDSPELAAGFVLWFTTQHDESDFLRGRYISCNWDVNELLSKKEEIIKKNLLWTRVVGQETELM